MKVFQKITLLILFFSAYLNAQEHGPALRVTPIPVEVFAGNNYLNVQMVVAKHFTEKSKWGFFNMTNITGDYKNRLANNEFVSQAMLNYAFFKGFSLTAGVAMNHKSGFRKIAGFQYVFANKKWLFITVPTVDLKDGHNLESINILEFKPQLTPKLGLYTRFQGLYVYNPTEAHHERSFVAMRAGLSVKNYQFGLGADANWYGPHKVFKENLGVFARVQLN
ncbi:MAG: hypothetical protein ACK4NY_01170 [Spirosomataceae bacterium]